jgi:hypothetical protein
MAQVPDLSDTVDTFYYNLLYKYINHIRDAEGSTYIDSMHSGGGFGGGFTEEELDFMRMFDKEIMNDE